MEGSWPAVDQTADDESGGRHIGLPREGCPHPVEVLPDVALQPGQDETGGDDSHGTESESDWLVLRLVDGAPGGILDAAPDGILSVDDGDVILSVNRQVESVFGYRREELIGRPIHLLLPLWPTSRSEPLDARRGSPRWSSRAAREVGRHRDGGGVPVEVSVSPLHTEHGLRAVVVLRAEPTTPEARVILASDLLELVHDGVWVVDAASLRVVYANRGLLQRLGYRRDDVVKVGVDVIAPEFADRVLRPLRARWCDDPAASLLHRLVLSRADGTGIAVEVRTQALQRVGGANAATEPDAYVCVARDLVDRAKEVAAQRNAEVASELVEERARIGRDLHDGVIQRIFATGMAVRALGAKAAGLGVDSEIARIADELDHCITDLRSAVDGIVPESDVEQGIRSDFMEVLADERAALVLTPNIRFIGQLDEIDAELRHQILAIFRELLSNVARHAHASEADIVVEATDDSFLLRVSDDGVGFDPARPRRGRGLGNLTQRAKLLGGSFTVRAPAEGGTVAECRVPFSGSER